MDTSKYSCLGNIKNKILRKKKKALKKKYGSYFKVANNIMGVHRMLGFKDKQVSAELLLDGTYKIV